MNARPLRAAVLLVALLPAGRAAAQDDEAAEESGEEEAQFDTTSQLGGDLAAVVPRTAWSRIAGVGLGLLLDYEWLPARWVGFTLRAGYLIHFSTERDGLDYTTHEAPVLGGLELSVGGRRTRVYVAGEGGFVMLARTVSDPVAHARQTDWSGAPAASVGAGLRSDWVDLRGSLFAASLEKKDRLVGVLVTLGFLAGF